MNISKVLIIVAGLVAVSLPDTLNAQAAGTYRLLSAGTSGGEKGYCGVGTVVIKSDKTVTVTTKSPLEPGTAPTYTGKASTNPFTVNGPNQRRIVIRMAYTGDKYIYGTYAAYRGSTVQGAGEYSMTRR